MATFTAVALTSLERGRLFDAMISVIAFRDQHSTLSLFRDTIETDPLVVLQPNYHSIDQRGFSASPGTPWGTDEMIYEATIGLPVEGEFVSDPAEVGIVDITETLIVQWASTEESDPTSGGGWIE